MPKEDKTPAAEARRASDGSSETPETFSMSSSILDTIINQAADRAVERAQTAFEKAVRGKLDEHISHIDERLDAIDARLKALEVKTPGDLRPAATSPPTAPASTPRFGAAPPPSSTATRPAPPPDSAAKTWEELPDEEKRAWRLHIAGLDSRPPPPHMPVKANVEQKGGKTTTRDSDAHAHSSKPLECKVERLPKFDGTPAALEEWIDRVRDVTRSNPDKSWNRAVMSAIPSVLTGAAARWHASLRDEEIEQRRSVADIFDSLRRAFPVNRSQIRQAALQRRWTPSTETAVTYAYDKLGLLRTAYSLVGGATKEEIELAEIVDGLPDTMRPMIRIPAGTKDMNDLVRELVEWEHVWRNISGVPLASTPSDSSLSSFNEASKSSGIARPKPAAPSPKVDAMPRTPNGATPVPGRPRYDPSRVREASATEPRAYMRENGSLMKLNRPCARCGEQHFDFEHPFLKEGAKAFPIVTTADHEIVDVDETDF
ncbi:hypothetical protein OC834_006809 [Tilletia horrida]|nr:hypothetical protein OC834_006809 [Tilletia horrida]